MNEKPVILFDGVCNLCNGFVQFIIRRDRKNFFRFGSLQSAKVIAMLRPYHFSQDTLSTVVLIENNKLYTRSTAVLKIARQLGGAWVLLYGLILIPRIIRDVIYDWVASNRYRIFGRRDACMVPAPEWKAKFIE